MTEAERKAAGLAADLSKAEQRTKLQQLTAPVSGIVQQLAVHTVGGVVTPAQSLMVIVPNDSSLEIEAMVSNHDVGFVHAGDEVEIKVDTFDFTRYGLLHGRVLSISSDAIVRDASADKASDKQPGSNAASSEPKGQELTYAARISVDRTQMQVEDKKVNLSPGMAVTAEIKTGSRLIIGYSSVAADKIQAGEFAREIGAAVLQPPLRDNHVVRRSAERIRPSFETASSAEIGCVRIMLDSVFKRSV